MAKDRKWPASLYDYERREIVDDEVAKLDLKRGEWVRCLCCDQDLQMKSTFGIKAWSSHKKTLRHRNNREHESDPTDQSPESTEYADSPAAMTESIEKVGDRLVLDRKELEKRAKYEVQAKKLMREMAQLVAEQQDDIGSLREEIEDLKELVVELHESIENIRQENRELRGSTRRKHHLDDEDNSPVRKRRLFTDTNRDERTDEIDMFDDEVHLMQSD